MCDPREPDDMEAEKLINTLRLLVFAVAVCVLSVACLQGCNEQDMETSVYKSLKVSAITYDAAMKTAAKLYADGYITGEQMEPVVDAATKYRAAYLTCVSLLEAWHKTTDPARPDDEQIRAAMGAYGSALAELIAIVSEYQNKHPPRGA